ncbi:MAG TPA: hypothetical protein VKA34_17085 [Balneolales bacterium]|nr:hypothetical protein [Balneolales bacterium]
MKKEKGYFQFDVSEFQPMNYYPPYYQVQSPERFLRFVLNDNGGSQKAER